MVEEIFDINLPNDIVHILVKGPGRPTTELKQGKS